MIWGAMGHSGVDQLAFFLPQAKPSLGWAACPSRLRERGWASLFAPLLTGSPLRLAGDAGPFALFLLADFVVRGALAWSEGEASEAAWRASPRCRWSGISPCYARDEALGAMFVARVALARRDRNAFAGFVLGLWARRDEAALRLLALPFVLGSARGAARGRRCPGRARLRRLLAWARPCGSRSRHRGAATWRRP